jgi:predicted permease
MEELSGNLRHAVRQLIAQPAFTTIAVLSLALGFGANVTLFTYVDALFLQPFPAARPAELAALYTTDPDFPGLLDSSYRNLRDLRTERAVFSGLAVSLPVRVTLRTAGGDAERLAGEIVSSDYFAVLGVRPALGRTFVPHDDELLGAHPEAVLSHGLWERRFAADRAIVGRQVSLNGRAFTVVGVAAKGFRGARPLLDPGFWLPLSMRQGIVGEPQIDWFKERNALMLSAVARLAPGVGERQAAAALTTLAAGLRREYPDDNKARGFTLLPLAKATLNPNVRGRVVLAGWLLMTMAGLVLALACANVANLLIARSLARRRDTAVRMALGASRARLIRQLLVENLLLALLGGGAGMLFAAWGRRLLWLFRPQGMPDDLGLSFDWRVLAFALALILATAVLCGLAPVAQTVSADVLGALKNQAAAARRMGGRGALVVAQIALSLLLLIGTGLFLRNLRQAQAISPGFAAERLLVLSVNPGAEGYGDQRGLDFCLRAAERVAALPGVSAAVLGANRPLERGLGGRLLIAGRQSPSRQDGAGVRTTGVGPGFFAVAGIRVLRGRPFTAADRDSAPPVAIINQTLARQFWPGAEPLGSRISFVGTKGTLEVVGVVADAKYGALGEPPQGYVYLPLLQTFGGEATLWVRTEKDPARLLDSVRRAVHDLDTNLPITGVRTVPDILAQSLWAPRAAAAILTLFGLLGLVLAALGTYSVMSYAVERRRREIGIRMALGARRAAVLGRVLRQGLTLAACGLLLGLLAAAATARFIASFLYGMSPFDAPTFAAAVTTLAAVALVATLVPARRATGVDPRIALRAE